MNGSWWGARAHGALQPLTHKDQRKRPKRLQQLAALYLAFTSCLRVRVEFRVNSGCFVGVSANILDFKKKISAQEIPSNPEGGTLLEAKACSPEPSIHVGRNPTVTSPETFTSVGEDGNMHKS
jgi:hypothetical protein